MWVGGDERNYVSAGVRGRDARGGKRREMGKRGGAQRARAKWTKERWAMGLQRTKAAVVDVVGLVVSLVDVLLF